MDFLRHTYTYAYRYGQIRTDTDRYGSAQLGSTQLSGSRLIKLNSVITNKLITSNQLFEWLLLYASLTQWTSARRSRFAKYSGHS